MNKHMHAIIIIFGIVYEHSLLVVVFVCVTKSVRVLFPFFFFLDAN